LSQSSTKLISQLPNIDENKEIAGLILSKINSLPIRPTNLRIVHNFKPLDEDSACQTIYVISNKTNFTFTDHVVIEYDVTIDALITDLKYKLDFLDSLVVASENGQERVELPLRYKHKTLVLCLAWERPYFVDHAQGTDFVVAFSNKTIVESCSPNDVLKNGYTEIIAMRRPELLRPFVHLGLQGLKLSVYQTEQMSVSEHKRAFISSAKSLGLSTLNVYDYSLYNISQYADHNFLTSFLPVETPEKKTLEALIAKTPKEYDFAHVGQLTSRRKKILDSIKEFGYTINIIENKWSLNRDKEIAKCKALLNIHQTDEHKVFETCRASRFLGLMPVYSEDSEELPKECININLILKKKYIIYVLCHTEDILKSASEMYKKFYWARPILMKYQDDSYENAFWKQLLEIKEEWQSAELVGTISASAYKKINLDTITILLRNSKSDFVHFLKTDIPFFYDHHPFLTEINKSIIAELNLIAPHTVWACNYWACSPPKMLKFIQWHTDILLPCARKNTKINEDAKYKNKFYSHLCFVLERLNVCFFNLVPL